MQDEEFNGQDRILKKYIKKELMIIEDMGIKEIKKRRGELLFEIVMSR